MRRVLQMNHIETNDPKLGDEVWYFQYPGNQGFGFLDEMHLDHTTITATETYGYIVSGGYLINQKSVELFKSKSDAITAMINRLGEMRDK